MKRLAAVRTCRAWKTCMMNVTHNYSMESAEPWPPPTTTLDIPETELTLALIKPDAVQSGHVDAILFTVEKHGFTVLTSTPIQLTCVRAEEFYELLEGRDCFEKLTRFISSGILYAFVLGKKNAVQEWALLIGPSDPDIARRKSPLSLRARYGTNIIRNAVHGSSSRQEAMREIKFFFPTVIMDPLPDEALSKDFFNKHLRETLVKGLTALAKAKPHSDPLQVITWLATWLQENNPNKPLVNGARLVVGLH